MAERDPQLPRDTDEIGRARDEDPDITSDADELDDVDGEDFDEEPSDSSDR